MRKLGIFLLLMFNLVTYSQKVISIKDNGVIFSKNYNYYLFDNLDRFTPTSNEINKLEILLNKNIRVINTNKFEPSIHENLNNYNRQYIGFYNEKREKVIYINFLWRENRNSISKEKWKTEWYDAADGGSYYWNIKYNLSNKTFFDFRVNTLG
ncbi:hypothetical protein [Flavobacterium sp.]|uniref:hypothetical protein n=1 Tax=Flavobacterium sp. TaxID=239 RepID=UPI0031CFA7E3